MIPLASPPAVLAAAPENQELAVAPLVLAFASDPTARWMYPHAHQFRTFFPRFVRVFAGQAFALGTAHYIEGFHATSLWLPPGVIPDGAAMAPLVQETVAPDRRGDLFAMLAQMVTCHPAKSHWYLPLFGVDARYQRRGYGSALLTPMLASFDREQATAYLDCTSPDNLPFFERHGFSVCGEIQSGTSPTLFGMLREPR